MRVSSVFILLFAGCAVAPAPVEDAREPVARTPAPQRERALDVEVEWPDALLVAEVRDRPVFHRGARPGAPGYAWVVPGTPVHPQGGVRQGRVRASIGGPVRVRGWVNVDALGGVVLRRGRVRGTPLYVVPGDQLRIRDARGGVATVEGAARLAHPTLARSPSFSGELDLDRLGADLAGAGQGPTPGRLALIRNPSPLFERPGGAVAWELPTTDPPLTATILRERGDWVGVRIGMGPYLIGYMRQSAFSESSTGAQKGAQKDGEMLDPWAGEEGRRRIMPSVADPWAHEDSPAPTGEGDDEANDETSTEEPDDEEGDEMDEELRGGVPPRVRAAAIRPVWFVSAGTRVRVRGAVVAVFQERGFAVEIERRDGQVEVIAAVNEYVTVRGLVMPSRLVALD